MPENEIKDMPDDLSPDETISPAEDDRFTEDIYSTSDLNHKIVFSGEEVDDSPEDKGDDPASPTFQKMETKGSFAGEEFSGTPLPDLPVPSQARRHGAPVKQQPSQPQPTAVNGVSWQKQHRRERREVTTLNNGEPLSFAMRKMLKETLIVLVCLVVVTGFFFGREFVLDKLTNNEYGGISTSAQYKKGYGVKGITPVAASGSDGYAVIGAIGTWAGTVVDESQRIRENEGKDITKMADGMERELQSCLPEKQVTRKDNLSNYSLLTQIYDSLKAKTPVLVGCSDKEGKEMSYAVVYSMNTQKSTVSVIRPDGTKEKISFNNFIAATRYETLKNISLPTKLGFATGIYNKNTAFFITEKEL